MVKKIKDANKKPVFYWHIHHRVLFETLTEPLRNRIKYIKEQKPADEVDLRLKLLKKVKGELGNTHEEIMALHKKECGCIFKGTIFTKENGLEKDC